MPLAVHVFIHSSVWFTYTQKTSKMHGLITVSIVFSSLIWLNLASIPYNDFHIKLIKTDGEVGQFETMLRQSMTTRKNFFARDDVKLITTGVSAVLKTVIGPLAATLPMIQSSLGKESDWKVAPP